VKTIVEKAVRVVRIMVGVSALAVAKMLEVAKDGSAEGFLQFRLQSVNFNLSTRMKE
jgi:hypothetical protein